MAEWVRWFIARENITFVIAVMSFALSAYNFVYEKYKTRKNLSIELLNVFSFSSNDGCSQIADVCMANKSTNPKEICGGREQGREVWYADAFPKEIPPLGAIRLLLVTDGEEQVFEQASKYRITFSTNRGKVKVCGNLEIFTDGSVLAECRAPDLQELK